MNQQQKETIEKAWRICRATTQQVQRVSDALANAAHSKAPQDRFDELMKKHAEACKKSNEAQEGLENAFRNAGLNV